MNRLVVAAVFTAIACVADASEPASYKPAIGYVPDAKAAVAIAYAVALPIYGAATLSSEMPLFGTLKRGIWTVEGTFHGTGVGGVMTMRIDQRSGAILYVMHGK
ncbi:YbbC/YhhH family protein [Sphingosinicellaceae bacterium]|nr:YbbC/YhhH family protein [Sphingosinicellaceae bacterium]